jgi:hypothetical protein
MVGYKFFEVKNGCPRSLVHGMPVGGKRSRMYVLDHWHKKEPGTPGFNVFLSEDAAKQYLPRFKVRASMLALCTVEIENITHKEGSNYVLAEKLHIKTSNWTQREGGRIILCQN